MRYTIVFVLAVLSFWAALINVSLADFVTGNLVVYRVAQGGTAGSAVAVFVDEYTTSGTLVQSIAMPTTASGSQLALTGPNTATSDGYLNLSTDGRYITVPGYNAAVGTASLTGTASATVNRVIGRIDYSGNIDTSTAFTAAYSTSSLRSVISTDGTDLWGSGNGTGSGVNRGGVQSIPFGTTTNTLVSTTVVNTRVAEIYGGQLYVTSGSAGFTGINAVGTGTPTTSGQTITALPGIAVTSPNGFFMADLDPNIAGLDTAYVANESGSGAGTGILKFTFNGTTWSGSGGVGTGTQLYRGMTGVVTANGVQLYLTRQDSTAPGIYGLLDASGFGGTLTTAPSLIAANPANTLFRGIDFTPIPEPGAVLFGALVCSVIGLAAGGKRLKARRAARG